MMKSISYIFRWRSVVARVVGILVAIVFLLAVSSEQPGAQTVEAIAAGDQHCLALMSDGTVYAWGSNWHGQVGDNTHHNNRFPPVQVLSEDRRGFLSGVQAIAGGTSHSMAAMSDGTLYTWGLENDCQLGISASVCPTTISELYAKWPQLVDEPPGLQVQAVAGGAVHSLALEYDSTVYAWGANGYCQLGVGSSPQHARTPLQVLKSDGKTVLSGVQAISAGYRHSLALMSDGTVWAWGSNENGQLGIGYSYGGSCYPVRVNGPEGVGVLSGVQAISAGYHHSLALMSDGTVYGWGANDYGQLGTNSTHEHDYPIQVQGPGGVEVSGYLSGIVSVAAGKHHSLALKKDGTVWDWGGNNNGQLGTNSTNEHHTPVQVQGPGGFDVSGYLSDVEAVDAGEFFNLALKNDGTVWAWGGNTYMQIDDSFKDRTTPRQIVGLGLAGSIPRGKRSAERVAICHKPGTPAEKTLYVPYNYNKIRAHLRRGSTLGARQ
jgi:alpha-tubulin suppressor-like RCC1 family protein